MIRALRNASLAGQDEWPKNITEAYNYLSKREGDNASSRGSCDHEGTTFTNREPTWEPQAWHAKMTCQNCIKVGHIASFCEKGKVSSTNLQVADAKVPKDFILKACPSDKSNPHRELDKIMQLFQEGQKSEFLQNKRYPATVGITIDCIIDLVKVKRPTATQAPISLTLEIMEETKK
jgi:hypothetical protein